MKEKLLVGLAVLSFIFASGEVEVSGGLGVVLQVLWSTICLMICLVCCLKLSIMGVFNDHK